MVLYDKRMADLETKLLKEIKGPLNITFMSRKQLECKLQLVQKLILDNKLDEAYITLSSMAPGSDVMVNVYKAEVQLIRAAISGDELYLQVCINTLLLYQSDLDFDINILL